MHDSYMWACNGSHVAYVFCEDIFLQGNVVEVFQFPKLRTPKLIIWRKNPEALIKKTWFRGKAVPSHFCWIYFCKLLWIIIEKCSNLTLVVPETNANNYCHLDGQLRFVSIYNYFNYTQIFLLNPNGQYQLLRISLLLISRIYLKVTLLGLLKKLTYYIIT